MHVPYDQKEYTCPAGCPWFGNNVRDFETHCGSKNHQKRTEELSVAEKRFANEVVQNPNWQVIRDAEMMSRLPIEDHAKEPISTENRKENQKKASFSSEHPKNPSSSSENLKKTSPVSENQKKTSTSSEKQKNSSSSSEIQKKATETSGNQKKATEISENQKRAAETSETKKKTTETTEISENRKKTTETTETSENKKKTTETTVTSENKKKTVETAPENSSLKEPKKTHTRKLETDSEEPIPKKKKELKIISMPENFSENMCSLSQVKERANQLGISTATPTDVCEEIPLEEYIPAMLETPCLDEVAYHPTSVEKLPDTPLLTTLFSSPMELVTPLKKTPVQATEKAKTEETQTQLAWSSPEHRRLLTNLAKDNSHHAAMMREELRTSQREQRQQHAELIGVLRQLLPPERSIAQDRLELAGLVGQMLQVLSRGHQHQRGYSSTCVLCQTNQEMLISVLRRANPELLDTTYPRF